MIEQPSLSELRAFTAIVTHRSFRKAADELGVSPSTLSHIMRNLEASLDVRLLHRTTRSLSPTEAGERLIARLQIVLQGLDSALAEATTFGDRPSGRLRINASEQAARLLLARVVPDFMKRYPDVELDLVTDGRFADIVAQGFDAGIRLGEAVPQDMVAVGFGGTVRFVAVAAPSYLADHPAPLTPDDLHRHACIRIRMPSGKPYRWEFERHGQEIVIDVPGKLVLDHPELMAGAAASGLGIGYMVERTARPYLDRGELVILLEAWSPPVPGLFLYYPGHRLVPPALRAFIDRLKALD